MDTGTASEGIEAVAGLILDSLSVDDRDIGVAEALRTGVAVVDAGGQGGTAKPRAPVYRVVRCMRGLRPKDANATGGRGRNVAVSEKLCRKLLQGSSRSMV